MKTVSRLLCAVAAVALGQVAHANLVSNPDFSNNFTDWTGVNSSFYTSVTTVADAFGNTVTAWHEGAVGYDRYEEQSISTTIGDTYQISFWLQPAEGSVSDYTASWGGTTVFDWNDTSGNITTAGTWSDYNASGSAIPFTVLPAWNHIVLDVTATSSSELLALGIRQDPGYSNLTEVDVEDLGGGNSSAPDGGLGLLAIAATLVGVCALANRTVRQAAL